MILNIESVLSDFERLIEDNVIDLRMFTDSRYPQTRDLATNSIQYLQPIIGKHMSLVSSIDPLIPGIAYLSYPNRFIKQKEILVADAMSELEKILMLTFMYGLMTFYMFTRNEFRRLSSKIDTPEVEREWFEKSRFPKDTLSQLGFYNMVPKNIPEDIFFQYWVKNIKPFIQSKLHLGAF